MALNKASNSMIEGAPVNVKDFGAVGDGVTDDLAAIQAVFDLYTGTNTPIYFPYGTYLISSGLDAYQQVIISDNATISCSDNSDIAIDIHGGAFYTRIYGHLTVDRQTPWASPAAQISGAFNVKIRCRVYIEELTVRGSYWDGINFNASSNLNKCIIRQANSSGSARHGFYVDGTQDDISVWQVNLRAQSNHESGIYIEDTSTARQWYGFFYTEANCQDATSYGCYLGGLDSSELFIYSEEQTSNKEINLPAVGANNLIFTGRANADINSQTSSHLVSGARKILTGSTGETINEVFVNLNNNPAKYYDIKKTTSVDEIFQERYYGNGSWTRVVADGDYTTAFSELVQNEDALILTYNKGNPDSTTKVLVSDTWSFGFNGSTGTTRTSNTRFANIKTTALSVGGGNKGLGSLVFGTANSSSASSDWIEIVSSGHLRPINDGSQSLGSSSRKWSEVFASTGTINTSDENYKTELLDIDDVESAVARELKSAIKKFKFKDSVEKKGDGARIHFGVGAQTVKAVFEKHSLDPDAYALFCYDEWEAEEEVPAEFDSNGVKVIEGRPAREAGGAYGIRYDQLLAFILAAL